MKQLGFVVDPISCKGFMQYRNQTIGIFLADLYSFIMFCHNNVSLPCESSAQ